jgi:hypothetical protein
VFILEYVLAVVTPLDGMMAIVGYDKASVPWHGKNMADFGVSCQLNK